MGRRRSSSSSVSCRAIRACRRAGFFRKTSKHMPSLREQFLALTPGQKRVVHFSLSEHALAKWTAFTGSRGVITYTESVCGTKQAVDATLPQDAFRCAQHSRDVANVQQRYQEPIVAMQDGDLELPGAVEFA